jgi:hypothetical protein
MVNGSVSMYCTVLVREETRGRYKSSREDSKTKSGNPSPYRQTQYQYSSFRNLVIVENIDSRTTVASYSHKPYKVRPYSILKETQSLWIIRDFSSIVPY